MTQNTRMLTYRKDRIILVGGEEQKIDYLGTAPNHFIINSSVADVLYVSDTPNVNADKYSKKLNGVSRQLYAEIYGLKSIYLKSASSGVIVVESYFADFNENSVSPTVETIDSSVPGTPKAEQVNLLAGVPYTLKATPGWVCAFGSNIVPDTQIRNGAVTVWVGDYISGIPFYCDTSIKLFCSVNNTVGIVYL